MARKTFISYKYSDAKEVRNKIIDSLGNDAIYYKGEDDYTDDLSSLKAETIKKHLKDMIHNTSVTIVVLSPEMILSNWIPWEIEYSLKEIARSNRHSRCNGIVAVIKEVNGGYSWLKTEEKNEDGHITHYFDNSKLPEIINRNRCNQNPKEYLCAKCGSVDWLTGSYISIVEEGVFLKNPQRFIENAYDKSQNISNYNIVKKIN